MTFDPSYQDLSDYPELSENALTILERRYLKQDPETGVLETPDEMFWRVAQAVAQAEAPEDRPYWANMFYDLMRSLKFLPNSPTLVNAGAGTGCLSACFTLTPEDNMESIMATATDAAMIEKWGGGVGFGLSLLRPEGDTIRTTHGQACGPIAVMKLYSAVGATLTQGSFRLGAHMAQIRDSHPDVLKFIHSKDDGDNLANFNISVQITDDFMEAAKNDRDWELINPRQPAQESDRPERQFVSARKMWREIAESAWKTGDPGVVFINKVWETAPNPQMGQIETSNPCSEEFMENKGNCCLGSINLDRHFINDELDYDELRKSVIIAIRFLDDVTTINTFPLESLREVNLATRRVGLGVMGFADMLVRLDIPYDSAEAIVLAGRVGKFMNETAWAESANLAEKRGAYPEYERSALKERGLPPVRNSSVITIAPTGTISRIAGCSSGIEPHFALAYRSSVLWSGQGAQTTLLDAPDSIRQSLMEQSGSEAEVLCALERIADEPEQAESLLESFGLNPAVYRTATGISPTAHVRMQAEWQKHVTNGVSKTINLPANATVEDVEYAFELAWRTGCKAITVYRDGSRSEQVLNIGTKEPGETKEKRSASPAQRPDSLPGVTTRVETPSGRLYVTVCYSQPEQKPFEVFIALGKADPDAQAHAEGISRLISLALRSGVSLDDIIEQLSGITSNPLWHNGRLQRSMEDALAALLRQHAQGDYIAMIAAQANADPSPIIHNGAVGPVSSSVCPEPRCDGRLVFQDGCLDCPSCGYSKCD